MNILETIKAKKIEEVAEKRALYPIKLLEKSIFYESPAVSLKKYLNDPQRSGIIAEFKRKSPSKGFINTYANAEEVCLGYMQAGAAALSVLTDENFFGAKKDDLLFARKLNFCPILRKDFIVDEYQIIEAKSMGADVILLIAKMLSPQQIRQFTELAQSLGMEVLLEIHNETEINENRNAPCDLFGVNHRNLDTFEVNLANSLNLIEKLPPKVPKIAESGIKSVEEVHLLKQNGFKGFLIGELFIRHSNPAEKCRDFIKQLDL
ncbi:MAG: indole-3-glycerol phosphate synthase TrpC [Thermonemataceae bacterium]|nr:indole-3-glycerol phosphate synthase TrpC [Thermonemataceae bacterium]